MHDISFQIPAEGVRGFTTNRYIVEIIAIKHQQNKKQPEGECKKHQQLLVLFCDEQGCQITVCSTCIITKHQGHKFIDINDKAENIKKEVREFEKGSQKMKDLFNQQLQSLKEAHEKFKNGETKTLNDLDRTRASLYQQVNNVIEGYKETTKKNGQKLQKEMAVNMKNIEERKAKLEECSQLAERVFNDTDANTVITQCQFMISQYRELERAVGSDSKIKTQFEAVCFFPSKHENFAEDTVGKMMSNVEHINMPGLMIPVKATTRSGADNKIKTFQKMSPFPKRQGTLTVEMVGKLASNVENISLHRSMMPVKATIVKSVIASTGCSIACNEEGQIYTYVNKNISHSMSSDIKSFDIDGNELMSIDLGNNQRVSGLTCAYVSGQSILVVTTANSIQIRNCQNGRLIHSLALGWEPGQNTVCITQDNNILVANYSESDTFVTEYQVKNMKIVETERPYMHIPVMYVHGLCHVTHVSQQLIVASSPRSSMIVALDYHSGDVVWRIDDPTSEGLKIDLRSGLSSDGKGHLFISDSRIGRVYLMTSDGKIHHALLKHMERANFYHQAWISCQRKLVVRDDRYFHVCDVSYEET